MFFPKTAQMKIKIKAGDRMRLHIPTPLHGPRPLEVAVLEMENNKLVHKGKHETVTLKKNKACMFVSIMNIEPYQKTSIIVFK